MQACHRGADAELRTNEAHAADPAGGCAQQGHHRINSQPAAAGDPHHQTGAHQANRDHQGGPPQLAQFPQGGAGQARADHCADADLQGCACSRWPARELEAAGHAEQPCPQ